MPIDNSSRHLYLMGNAYLNGIEVEMNFNRAIELISASANMGFSEAYKKLISIYNDGFFTSKELEKVLFWEKQYIKYLKNIGKDSTLDIFYHLRNTGDVFFEMKEYRHALDEYELAHTYADLFTQKRGNKIDFRCIEEWQCLSDIYLKKGQTYEHLGILKEAEECYKRSLKIDIELNENEETTSHGTLRSLSHSFIIIGDFYLRREELIKAKHAFKHSIQLLEPSQLSILWMDPNRDDLVRRGYFELEEEKFEYQYLEYAYVSLAKIAVRRLQIKGGLSNYKKARIYAYQLYEIDKPKWIMLELIEINMWIALLGDFIETVDMRNSSEAEVEMYAIKEYIKQYLFLCFLKTPSDLERIVIDTLKIANFEKPVEIG